jgi:hypothetical protein
MNPPPVISHPGTPRQYLNTPSVRQCSSHCSTTHLLKHAGCRAGMDPINRRHVWDVIEAAKRDRYATRPWVCVQGSVRPRQMCETFGEKGAGSSRAHHVWKLSCLRRLLGS